MTYTGKEYIMNQSLKTKDLVTIGVFAVIYFVGMYAVGMMGMVPILFLFWPFVNGLIMSVPVMLFLAKVPKPWALFIFTMIAPTLMFLMGHTYITFVHGLIIAFLAEMVRRQMGYKTIKGNIMGTAVFSMWACGSMTQIFFVKEQYLDMTTKMMGADYAAKLSELVTWPNMALVYVGALIGGILGAIIGHHMLKKHFEKAGII